jgi:hypothetical protein
MFMSEVKGSKEGGTKTYELSLFGVILALTLIYHFDTNKLAVELFYGGVPSSFEYAGKIATNYKDRLPLIFGKWDIVTDVLKKFAFYNFDVIVEKSIHLRDPDNVSVTRGGNKEIYNGITEIILQRRFQLEYFADAGKAISFNYLTGISGKESNAAPSNDYLMDSKIPVSLNKDKNLLEENLDRVKPVYNLLWLTLSMLSPIEYFYSRSKTFGNLQLQDLMGKIFNMFEESFADEITVRYYMNLYTDSDIRLSDYRKQESFEVINRTPKQCLSLLLEYDNKEPLIRDWFCKWAKDLVSFQQEIVQNFEAISRLA